MLNAIGIDLTANDATPKWKLGTLCGNIGTDGPQKIYKYVKYLKGAGSIAAGAGKVAYYPTVTVSGTNALGTVVTCDLSDSDEVGAGVMQATVTDTYCGWVQVHGIATLAIALTAGTDGDPLTPTGSTDGTLDLCTAITDNVCATAIDISEKIVMCNFTY